MMQKIKLMKQQPKPSDEEIQSYMNFDRLLANQKISMNTHRLHALLKWGLPSLIATAFVVWFSFEKNKDKHRIRTEIKAQTDSAAKSLGIPLSVTTDSLSDEDVVSDAPP